MNDPKLRIDCYGSFSMIYLEDKALGVGVKRVEFKAEGSNAPTLVLELDMKAFESNERFPEEKKSPALTSQEQAKTD